MSRSVVYSPSSVAPAPRAPSEPTFGGPGAPPPPSRSAAPIVPVDDYSDKLIKYVPAEVVAFFIPIGALLQDRLNLLIVAAIVGLVATPGYLWRSAQSLPVSQRPPMHTYVLAGVSFAVWAIATSAIGGMIGLDSVASAFLLGVTVFLIPLADSILARATGKAP